ncbi:hypothetical protein J14TS5_58850 [Paenibacillus lautus]|nr:hypothetical protein J14TS5_58850 [Paenibacillus lautus]
MPLQTVRRIVSQVTVNSKHEITFNINKMNLKISKKVTVDKGEVCG